jgi:hypothetical protein
VGQPVGDIARRALSAGEIAAEEMTITDLQRDPQDFAAEAFFNEHNLFVMITERKAVRFGRRVHIAAG